MSPKKSFFAQKLSWRWFASIVLFTIIFPSYAGYNTAFYLNTSSYTGTKGGNITGTVTREAISTGCTSSCDWFPASPAYVSLQIPYPGTGTNPIEYYDVSSNGLYTITIPANQTSASFSIPVPQNSSVDYDRTGNLNIASGYVDATHIQSATLKILDNNNPVAVGFVSGGTFYVGTPAYTNIIEGATGGWNQAKIRFFRSYATDARTINYSLSGSTAVAGTDYTPSIGTITIPNEANYVDVTVTANNTNQSVDKTINVTVTSGTYSLYAPYTNMEVYIYNDFPTVDVGVSSSQMIRGDTTSSLIFEREVYWPNSGTARTIHYSLAGSTAVNGVDYTPSLSGTVVIPAGGYAVTNTLTPAIESTTNGIKYLDAAITASSGYSVGAYNSTSIEIDEDFPNVDIVASPTMMRGESTATLIFERETIYPGVSAAKTVNYTLAGSTAVNGVDYTPSLSGSAVIPAGAYTVTNTLTPGTESSLNGTKILNMSLQPGTMYFYGAGSNATIGILEDAPMIGVTATTPDAIQNGASGMFTVTRTYGYPKSVTASFTLSGTAIAGTNYTNLPLSVTFAPYQVATNLIVGATGSPILTNARTIVLNLSTNSLYYLAVNTQAVVTILPPGSATNSVASPVGRYWRGTGSDPTYWSSVVPLDSEKGVLYSNTFGNCSTLYPGLLAWSASTYYHYNETNTLSQTNWTNRIPFNNPVVAFGERIGGTPLYLNQEYNFGIYAGDPIGVGTPIEILAFYRTNFAFAGETDVYPPKFSNTNSWNSFTSNGLQVTASGYGLTTTLSTTPKLSFGATTLGAYALTHTASGAATNYYYVVLQYGLPNDSFPIGMAQDTNGYVAPSYLYSLEFEQRPPWRAVMIDQPHFDGSPLPPFYAGMTLDELLTNTPPVSNSVSLSPSACTNIDQSPELRRSPILDQFVADMGNDPVALANYVLNDIDLTDPMDYNDDGTLSEQSINPSGVTRGALGAFLEKQGSPVEQCALLVYLLRQAGVPATYMFPVHNGLQILDARLSRMLKFQVHGSFNDAGQLYSSNTMIAVNYPWVAAYIGTNWVHIFPWLKDYGLVEGLNLYEYMPTNYSSAYGWAKDYIYGASNLLSLAVNGDNTPRVIFPRYLAQTLQQNYPGVSVDDIGMQVLLRRHNYSRWQDFPTPTWLTNASYTVESLSANSITNVDPLMTNVFDTLSIEIYSQTDPHKDIQTGPMRLTDLHNRQFYITETNNATNQILLSLVLSPFRTNVTTQYSFTNDSSLLSKEVLSTTLDQFDDQLWVRFTYNRHRALSPSYAINPYSAYLGFAANRHIVIERPLRKGELAAICLDYGRVTQDMLNVHAQDLWQMENTLRTNSSASISPDVYQGATIYLAGMSYYKKLSDFDQINQNLHKVDVLSGWAAGLSKLSPRRDSSGNLANGGVDPVLPNVDMFAYDVATVGNASSRPDSGESIETATQNYNLIRIVDGSAEEHQVLNDYYQQSNAVSTVRLLQLAQSRGLGIVPLNINTYISQGTTVYQGSQLQNFDPYVWSQIASAFQNNNDDYGFVTAYITPGPVTNSSYSGIGAFIFGFNQQAALISPNSLNGAFGENLPSDSVSPGNTINYNLTMGDTATLTFQPPTSGTALLPDQTANFNSGQVYNQILSGDYTATPYDSAWSVNVVSSLNLSFQSTQNQTLAQDVQQTQQTGFWGTLSDMGSQFLSTVGDPVNNITGEFYVNEADLRLAGPIPLSLGRNYSSLNLADNQFGPGWKFSIAPYLSVAQGNSNIYAADMDGSVLNYARSATNSNLWMPTTAANPQLENNTTAGVGGLVNRLRDRLVQTVNGSTTNFTLYGADGSLRTFQYMTFNNGALNQTRPYLLAWTNNCGNFYTFTYGTDPSQPDFGQVRRIQCSNGNYLGFYYDVYGHIIQAYCGDGRRLTYDYDQFGDLITVTLPDATTRSYQYLHSTQSVTNGSTVTQQPYSTHLIIEADKPDGRVLQNAYDSQRRVTNQLSTAGADLTPVRTATFTYSNNFNVTNSPTNTISGYTVVIDGNNGTNRYDYTNSLITQVTDPVGQTIQQVWYADNATAPGYPRSVSQRKDKRGTWTQFKYDPNGNITNTVITGDLTGDGIPTQTATNTAVYNTNNLPLQRTDPVGNSTVYVYDPNFLFLPQQIIRYAGATPVSTNFQVYGSATNVVTLGSITQTNFARGLMTRAIRAYNYPEAATNDFTYNGQGFVTQSVAYTGTSDPAVTNTFFYDERGEIVDQTDALGATTEFAYDDMGRQTEQENFDENGNLLSWDFNYYNDNGELTWVDGPRYNPEDYIWQDYDGAGRATTEIHWRCEGKQDGTGVQAPAGYNLYSQGFNSYDVMGNLTRMVDPRGAITSNRWDSLCRLVQRQSFDVDGVTLLSSESFGYEPGGLVRFHTNALGGVTETDYTVAGQPEYRHNTDGSTNAWRYYLDGRIYREFQGNGAYVQTTYDDVNRITTKVFYSAAGVPLQTNAVQLDRRGNTIQKTDANGNVFATTFDGLDRAKISEGPAIVTVNSIISGLNPGGTPTYVTNVSQQTINYFYDGSGRVLTSTNTLGERTVTTKDAIGRIITVQIYAPGSGTPLRVTTNSYSPDHHSVTVTAGTGSGAISTTTYVDNDGRTLITSRSPGTGRLDYDLHTYDFAGNEIEHDKASTGSVLWFFTSWTFDGLNRTATETSRDYATTAFRYDQMGDLTNRAMPGNLTWSATYSTAGQMLAEWDQSGTQGARTNTYTYYSSSWPGLLQTVTDERGVTRTNFYDDFLRLTNTTTTGSQAEQQMSVVWQYDPRGLVSAITQSYANTNTGLTTTIQRAYDTYSQLSSDTLIVGGSTSAISQQWDSAGRRTQLSTGMSFQYQADNLITAMNDASYGFGDNGLLTGRTNSFRSITVNSRDPLGRPLQATTKVYGTTQLTETWNWLDDGFPSNYVAARGDFTDTRNFSYGALTRKLTQETLNLGGSLSLTNNYTFDNGVGGGLGVLTKATELSSTSNSWTGGVDALSRITTGTNTVIERNASGHVNGAATLRGYLNSQPLDLRYDSRGASAWSATLGLQPGTNTLVVYADHPGGLFTTNRISTFTVNSGSQDRVTSQYDGVGNVTNLTWKNATGQTIKTQTLTWDAFNRLVKANERDTNNNGFNLVVTFDALGRQVQTVETTVSNNIALTTGPEPLTIGYQYDPQVDFEVVSLSLNQGSDYRQDSLTYGPDISGHYGGMQGVGGLEEINSGTPAVNSTAGIISDGFGNVLAGITNGVVAWNPARSSLYGPADGYSPPRLSLASPAFASFAWRSRSINTAGFVQLGLRPYDFTRRAFLCADPLGHGSDEALNTAFGGNPAIYFDADGRIAKGVYNEGALDASALSSGVFWGGVADTSYNLGARTVNGVAQAGEIGYDMTAQSAWALGGAGGDYQGVSQLYQNIYNNPSSGPTASDILTGTLEAEANIGTLGLYGMGQGFGQAAATGDYTAAQDASLGSLLLSTGVRGMQAAGIDPLGVGYVPTTTGNALLSLLGVGNSDAPAGVSSLSSATASGADANVSLNQPITDPGRLLPAGSTPQEAPVNVLPSSGSTFVVSPGGDVIVVPSGAAGPTPIINEGGNTTGFGYTGGSGGPGLSPRVSNVRIMDPTLPKGPSPGYPAGYVNYQNGALPKPQSVNPFTGQTIAPNNPLWHIPLTPQ